MQVTTIIYLIIFKLVKGFFRGFKKISSINKNLSISAARHLIGTKIDRKNGKVEIDESLLSLAFLEEINKVKSNAQAVEK